MSPSLSVITVKRNLTPEIAKTLALVVILISSGIVLRSPECEAQNRLAAAEYDYYSLALTSISNSAREASKLPDMSQRVKLLLYAAKILAPSQHDEATRLLDVALADLKQWTSEEKASWYQRHTAATLRSEVFALYARVDPEKTAALQKEFQAEAKSTTTNSITSLKSDDWFTQFSDRSAIADQSAKIAFSLLHSDPEKALRLVAQSLQGGTVSSILFDIVQKLAQEGNRALLNRLEIGIGQALAANVTFDPFSLTDASLLVQTDKDMPAVARNAFVNFLMRSLQAWSILAKEPGINTSYISRAFFAFSQTVRPVISMHSPDQLIVFDLVLDQVAPLVPAKMKSVVQSLPLEKFSDPRDRLNDILSDPSPDMRDGRLIRFVSGLLRSESENFEKNLDLASDAINGFSNTDAKAAYTDLLTIIRINALVKQEKFIEAQHLAGSISSEDTRAWVLLALATVAAKTDRVLGFELISNALKALDKASPSPNKVQLALLATAMLAKSDPQRAFETLSTSSRYANSSAAKVDPPTKPPFAFGLQATIGEAHTKLGVFPDGLGELEINSSLATLATVDWFRADQIVNDIREPSLRLQLKLQFAGAVLARESKLMRKEATPKASLKN
jgi:hypothetical protein